jgi:hypothetical protein
MDIVARPSQPRIDWSFGEDAPDESRRVTEWRVKGDSPPPA